MTKKDDELKEAVNHAIDKRLLKLVLTVCVTTTSTIVYLFFNIGHFLYDRYDAVKASIVVFIEMTKGR